MWDEQSPVQSLHSAIKKAVEEDMAKQKHGSARFETAIPLAGISAPHYQRTALKYANRNMRSGTRPGSAKW